MASQQERSRTVEQSILREWASKLNLTLNHHFHGKLQITGIRLDGSIESKKYHKMVIIEDRLTLVVEDMLVQWIVLAATDSNQLEALDEIGRITADSILKNLISDFYSQQWGNPYSFSSLKLIPWQPTFFARTIVFKADTAEGSYEWALLIEPKTYLEFLMGHPGSVIRNLDQMRDVQLTIRAQLGSIRKKVKEIMDLSVGTVIELEQNVDSMCRLMVNDQCFASGDVIEVNGNFGVLIQTIHTKSGLLD